MTNEEIGRAACRVIWSEGNLSRVREFYADDFRVHASPVGPSWGKGVEGVKQLAASLREAFPDYHETIEDIVAAGDRVVARLTVRGTHRGPLPFAAATGKAVEVTDISICRIENGKIAEQWAVTDQLTMLAQLGLLELPQASAATG